MQVLLGYLFLLNIIYLILILYVIVLVSIAFFTLLERKILGYIHLRQGPNKVIIKGFLQPVIDGLKLFIKENMFSFNVNKFLFSIFPFFSLFMILFIWQRFFFFNMDFLLNRFLFYILFSSLRVYAVIGSAWVSNSKYAILGCYRRVSQVVSYEVGLIFLIMLIRFFTKNFSFRALAIKSSIRHINLFGFIFILIVWVVVILAELNRAPFDFAESESELVSGFNIEFGGLKFAFLFLSEYGIMIYMSYLTVLVFLAVNLVYCVFVIALLVWVRGVFPRYRYDNLIHLNWKVFLPIILIFFAGVYEFMVFN